MIFILCAVVLVAGFVLAFYLKREGERNWRSRQNEGALRAAMVRLTITLRDDFTPKMRRVGISAQRATAALATFGEAFKKAAE